MIYEKSYNKFTQKIIFVITYNRSCLTGLLDLYNKKYRYIINSLMIN